MPLYTPHGSPSIKQELVQYDGSEQSLVEILSLSPSSQPGTATKMSDNSIRLVGRVNEMVDPYTCVVAIGEYASWLPLRGYVTVNKERFEKSWSLAEPS
jgi:hypothetical protein